MRVSAVQPESVPGSIEQNLGRAAPLIRQAASDGAELVVLPELSSVGYIPNPSVWRLGEPLEGPTVSWMRKLSGELGIVIGAGFVEASGRDYYNSYALTGPDGLLGVVRKRHAESWCFRRHDGDNVIPCPGGRIGIGICADAHFTSFLLRMQRREIDLLLMPHAWPTPYRIARHVSQDDIERAREQLRSFPSIYADCLGVPVVFANMLGPMGHMPGLLGRLMTPSSFRLEGHSRIVDGDGSVLAELKAHPGVIVCDVTSRPRTRQPKDYGGWLHPGSALVRRVILPLDGALSRLHYRLNPRRWLGRGSPGTR